MLPKSELMAKMADTKWEDREVICERLIEGKEDRQLWLDYVESRANSVKARDFMRERSLVWSDLTKIYHGKNELWALMELGTQMGEQLRQQLREDEADRRGIDGVERDVRYKGRVVGQDLHFSDTLLLAQLKAGDPEKYAERKDVRHSGTMLNINVEGVYRENDEELVREKPVEGDVTSGSDVRTDNGKDGVRSDLIDIDPVTGERIVKVPLDD